MSRFVEAWVAEDECTLAWVVDGEAGVVDGGRNAIEVAHLAAVGIFVLELAHVATPSPSPTSPPPPPRAPTPSSFSRLSGLSDGPTLRSHTRRCSLFSHAAALLLSLLAPSASSPPVGRPAYQRRVRERQREREEEPRKGEKRGEGRG
jgi:hypothetical protein